MSRLVTRKRQDDERERAGLAVLGLYVRTRVRAGESFDAIPGISLKLMPFLESVSSNTDQISQGLPHLCLYSNVKELNINR